MSWLHRVAALCACLAVTVPFQAEARIDARGAPALTVLSGRASAVEHPPAAAANEQIGLDLPAYRALSEGEQDGVIAVLQVATYRYRECVWYRAAQIGTAVPENVTVERAAEACAAERQALGDEIEIYNAVPGARWFIGPDLRDFLVDAVVVGVRHIAQKLVTAQRAGGHVPTPRSPDRVAAEIEAARAE